MDSGDPQTVNLFAGEGALLPEHWGAMIDACPDAVLVVDAQRKIRGWNRRATELFEYTHEEAIGQDFSLLVPEDRRATGELDWLSAWNEQGGTVREFLTERRTKEGRVRLVRLSRHVFRDADGGVSGAIAVLRDVTESEREIRRATDALHLARLGQLAAQLAHEMRNPLAGIHGALQILQRRLDADGQEEDVFSAITDEVRRLDQLVQDLQRFARPASSQRSEVHFDEWLEAACRKWESGHENLSIELKCGAGVVLTVDPIQLEQILQELIGNAVEASEPKAVCVRVSSKRTEQGCELELQDDGPGVPDDARARIFEPFVTQKARGSGLGLAVARRHAETLGGSLDLLTSETGARFLLTLPLA